MAFIHEFLLQCINVLFRDAASHVYMGCDAMKSKRMIEWKKKKKCKSKYEKPNYYYNKQNIKHWNKFHQHCALYGSWNFQRYNSKNCNIEGRLKLSYTFRIIPFRLICWRFLYRLAFGSNFVECVTCEIVWTVFNWYCSILDYSEIMDAFIKSAHNQWLLFSFQMENAFRILCLKKKLAYFSLSAHTNTRDQLLL